MDKRKITEKHSKKYAKSTRDLESMMTKINLDGIDDDKPLNPHKSWQRSSSITSTKSLGSPSTPLGTTTSSKNNNNSFPRKPLKKRRKSFSLGMSSY